MHSDPRKNAPFSTQHPLVTKFEVDPAGKGEIGAGACSLFTEKAMKDEFGAERQQIDN